MPYSSASHEPAKTEVNSPINGISMPIFSSLNIDSSHGIKECQDFIEVQLGHSAVLSPTEKKDRLNFKFDHDYIPHLTIQLRPGVPEPIYRWSPYLQMLERSIPSVEKTRAVLQISNHKGVSTVFKCYLITEHGQTPMGVMSRDIMSLSPDSDYFLPRMKHLAVCLASYLAHGAASDTFSPCPVIERARRSALNSIKVRLRILRKHLPEHLRCIPRFCLSRASRLNYVGGAPKLPPIVSSDVQFEATTDEGMLVHLPPATQPHPNTEITWAHYGHDFYIFEDLMGYFDEKSSIFKYYVGHRELRKAFWNTLDEVMNSKKSQNTKLERKALQVSYTIGFLFRYGFMPNSGLYPTSADVVTSQSNPEYFARLEAFAKASNTFKREGAPKHEFVSDWIDSQEKSLKSTRLAKAMGNINDILQVIKARI
ncbi:hypothetical protein Cpir12675_005129 [Ceratocystis pirilliformis]|uniref:Uncharacterized protein n=1 Tax=Ceratocystis pirilliformis TaxID=259994 RepID=A0ABR3YRT5_9PEZI